MDSNYKNIAAEFSNEELLIMMYQLNQWEPEMLAAIELELAWRNILPEDVQRKKEAMILQEDEMLSEGKEATFPQQFLGWIGVLGILGLIIGFDLGFAKTISKYTGKEYFKYNENSRESGRYMFYISIAVIVLFCFYKMINYIEYYY